MTVRLGRNNDGSLAAPVLLSLPRVVTLDSVDDEPSVGAEPSVGVEPSGGVATDSVSRDIEAERSASGEPASEKPPETKLVEETPPAAAPSAAATPDPQPPTKSVEPRAELNRSARPPRSERGGRSSGGESRPGTRRPPSRFGAPAKVLTTLIVLLLLYLAWRNMGPPAESPLADADTPIVEVDDGQPIQSPVIEAPGLDWETGGAPPLIDDGVPSTEADPGGEFDSGNFESDFPEDAPMLPEMQAPPLDAAMDDGPGSEGPAESSATSNSLVNVPPSAPVAPPQQMGPDYRYNPYPRTDQPDDTVEFLRMSMLRGATNTPANPSPGLAPAPPFGDSENDTVYR